MVTRHTADLDDQEPWPRKDPVWIKVGIICFIAIELWMISWVI